MLRVSKWVVPVVAMGLMLGLGAMKAAAADTGTVMGTVTGTDGKPAAGVMVKLNKAHGKGEPKPAAGEKPVAVATATTDENGKFEMKDVPAGDYVAMAGGKKAGGAGREKVTVSAGANAEVSITLKAAEPKSEGDKKEKKEKKHGEK